MKKSFLFISLTFVVACSSHAADKNNTGTGWTLGQNNSTSQNNGTQNNNVTPNNVSSTNNVTSINNVTGSSNNATTTNNNTTTGGGGMTTHAECNVNSECRDGLFCCLQGFQQGPGTCESSCQMNGGKCGGNHDECDLPTSGCCKQLDVCHERCTPNPQGTVCRTNPDCSNGQLCCPNFNGGDSTCADDCGAGGRFGGICESAADCGGQTTMCCDLPIGNDKLCLQQCGF